MKSCCIAMLLVNLLALTGLPVSNAATQFCPEYSPSQFRLSFYTGFITNREFANGSDYNTEVFHGMLRAEYILEEYLVFFGELGAAQSSEMDIPGTNDDLHFDAGPAIGCGVTGHIYDIEDINATISAGGRLLWFLNSGSDKATNYYGPNFYETIRADYDMQWQELQVSGVFDYAGIERLNLYGGVLLNLFARVSTESVLKYYQYQNGYEQNWRVEDTENRYNTNMLGIFAGASYKLDDMWSVTGELHFIDENSFSIGGQLRL